MPEQSQYPVPEWFGARLTAAVRRMRDSHPREILASVLNSLTDEEHAALIAEEDKGR